MKIEDVKCGRCMNNKWELESETIYRDQNGGYYQIYRCQGWLYDDDGGKDCPCDEIQYVRLG